ncbi:carbohydrate ABC transporter permease [Mobiluncus curtisii]|uniref:ABC transporter, permease protein n=5 Tax=Mobiluncus TaxID=2050 RepID=D6ZHR5_MOBCV|nr:carbohydrate ABC transporter permease [Mobiluncus curtisii]ADI68173.1 ABC transporter, permease protein [Mobiluncus curtisii ATCC 43063]EFU82125.1 ABC transporter, permease protein [Mobiluncus holmesii ATCC 35242]MCU9987778.1 carbohydrate ABC transporter permease [Mobiluncus curtisii]MCV0000920.1 carbohydrate ABC transporter permease [Mobiluncus curtisii]MCV0021616.1 carbohydrate ABC transporter permease [Mobiluncus curtisii]
MMQSRTPMYLKIIKVCGLTLWFVITVFPLYWILLTSFKPASQIAEYPVRYWPRVFSIENYVNLFSKAQFGTYMFNSLTVSLLGSIVATLIALLSGYTLSRFTFRSKGAVLIAFLVTQMIPMFIALGPLYQMFTTLGLIDTRAGLVLIYIAMTIPFSSIMLRGFFDNVPDSLEEAAMVDGLNRFSALWRIIVPVMLPGITATFIFNFVNIWNELFLSVTLINSDSKRTIPTALNSFISSFNIEWGPMSAAAVLTIFPTMILFSFASRWIVAGLTQGATKG